MIQDWFIKDVRILDDKMMRIFPVSARKITTIHNTLIISTNYYIL